MLEVNGDTEFLYDRVKNLPVYDRTTFLDVLIQSYEAVGITANMTSSQFLTDHTHRNDPTLTIRVPSLNEVTAYEWNTAESVPPVVFMAHDHDEDTHSQVVGFKSDGSQILIAVDPEPISMVLVIKENERLEAVDLTSNTSHFGRVWNTNGFEPVHRGSIYTYYQYVELLNQQKLNIPDTDLDMIDESNSRSCYRDNKDNRDRMYSFKWANCDSWKKYCDWLDGRCELEATWVSAANPSNPVLTTLKKGFNDNRKDFITTGKNKCRNSHQPKWYIIYNNLGFHLEYYKWNLDDYADVIKYVWMEKDGSSLSGSIAVESPSGKFKLFGVELTAPKITGTIKIDPKDDELFEDAVYHCDSYGTQYATGRVQFTPHEP